MGVLDKDKMDFEVFKKEVQRLAKIGDDIKAEYRAKKAAIESGQTIETPIVQEKAGEGRFTKQQVIEKIIQQTMDANPTDEYVQKTFPNFLKEIKTPSDIIIVKQRAVPTMFGYFR